MALMPASTATMHNQRNEKQSHTDLEATSFSQGSEDNIFLNTSSACSHSFRDATVRCLRGLLNRCFAFHGPPRSPATSLRVQKPQRLYPCHRVVQGLGGGSPSIRAAEKP